MHSLQVDALQSEMHAAVIMLLALPMAIVYVDGMPLRKHAEQVFPRSVLPVHQWAAVEFVKNC